MPNLSRRSFLMGSCSALLLVPRLSESAPLLSSAPRSLSFYNLHTSERLKTEYWARGAYAPEALFQIDHILRDHRNGERHTISTRLLDTLHALSLKLDTGNPFEIISGFRSPATNAALRKQGHNVAERSLHMEGLAIDVRVAGRSLTALRDAALSLKAGGVGYYSKDGFVHVDVGRVRSW
jgi:uncharacterized protein YcbK (DUF882 family)